jgi:hypothetical protein
MTDVLAEYVIRTLIPALPKAHGRVHRGSLADIPNPVYPLVYFVRPVPGRVLGNAPVDEFRLVVGFCSAKSLDEAWELYLLADPLLDRSNAVAGDDAFVLERVAAPFENTDTTGSPVYRVIVMYLARLVR